MAPLLSETERKLWERQFRPLTEVEKAEVLTMSIEEKFRQLAILMDLARRLNYQEHTEGEIDAVRQRWIRLKKLHAEGKLKASFDPV